MAIKFRGTKVLEGADAGCSFFSDALVNTELEAAENMEDWTYEIYFQPVNEWTNYDIATGSGSSVCVDGMRKKGKTYGVIAEPGK
ncbi:hypothetical protein GJ744_012438 [Endocarpon pusillum]|uniref:Uncharacterized protein n=1 Tax=Endocarpon pusillum TaxID=364733 RepID=A0A8H7E2N9_9EURO|nr:hypothetical protein GJ744_012438 [Endocarpon pusillum]